MIFTGTVVVIPDIFALAAPGERAEVRRDGGSKRDTTGTVQEGVKGLRALGVRDLSYRLAFIANSVQVCCLLHLNVFVNRSFHLYCFCVTLYSDL